MFLGQYEHTVDTKGRMTIPVRFRELLEEGAYITQGFDLNLVVLTASAFERISEYVNQMSLTDPSARQLKRLIFPMPTGSRSIAWVASSFRSFCARPLASMAPPWWSAQATTSKFGRQNPGSSKVRPCKIPIPIPSVLLH